MALLARWYVVGNRWWTFTVGWIKAVLVWFVLIGKHVVCLRFNLQHANEGVVCLFVCLFVYLFVCLFVCLSVCLFVVFVCDFCERDQSQSLPIPLSRLLLLLITVPVLFLFFGGNRS